MLQVVNEMQVISIDEPAPLPAGNKAHTPIDSGANNGIMGSFAGSNHARVTHQYAVSDFAVGGRCKCNGHASRCIQGRDGQLACDCRHNTAGRDCERCKPFHYDRPWSRATAKDANECKGRISKMLAYTCLLGRLRTYLDIELLTVSISSLGRAFRYPSRTNSKLCRSYSVLATVSFESSENVVWILSFRCDSTFFLLYFGVHTTESLILAVFDLCLG